MKDPVESNKYDTEEGFKLTGFGGNDVTTLQQYKFGFI